MLSLPRAWVQSLVGELRSRKPRGVAKKQTDKGRIILLFVNAKVEVIFNFAVSFMRFLTPDFLVRDSIKEIICSLRVTIRPLVLTAIML